MLMEYVWELLKPFCSAWLTAVLVLVVFPLNETVDPEAMIELSHAALPLTTFNQLVPLKSSIRQAFQTVQLPSGNFINVSVKAKVGGA